MNDIRAAIMGGTLEASRALVRLGLRDHWERQRGRIDVFGAIDASKLPLMFRPMEGLLGALFVRPSPGVMVNTRRPLSVQRYTAAHELGHYLLGHEPSLDDESILRRNPFADRPDYDPQEIAADAFAVAFLLPQWLVHGEMQRHGWKPAALREPANVYQLALRAGVSYEATCYALQRYKVIDAATCMRIAAIEPKSIKQSIIPGYQPANWRLDVWELNEGDDGLFVKVSPGDVLDLALVEHSGGGYTWDVGGLANTEFEVVNDRRDRIGDDGTVGAHVVRHVTARAKSPGVGSVQLVERRPWEQGVAAITSYRFSYDVSPAAQEGLLAAQRERLLGGVG